MKVLMLATMCVLFSEATYAQSKNSAEDQVKQMEWLLGYWNRTNAKPGRTAHERWQKNTGMEWIGYGVTMNGKDTLFMEKLMIIIKDGKIFYVADVLENKGLVYFEMKDIGKDGFSCENPAHDFPKKIEYRREAGRLTATISGDGKKVDYIFEKKQP